jgi:hypothetical protein
VLGALIDTGSNATLGACESSSPELQVGAHQGRNNGQRSSKMPKCPCRPAAWFNRPGNRHSWKPEDCRTLSNALQGKPTGKITFGSNDIRSTKERLQAPECTALRAALAKKGIMVTEAAAATSLPSPFDGKAIIAIISPTLMQDSEPDVYSTAVVTEKHYLVNSTLLANCGAVHLVNDISLLDGGRCEQSTDDVCVECGIA